MHFLLLPFSEEAKTGLPLFFFVQCIIKRLTDVAFEISRTIKVLVRVISVSLRLQLITITSILIIILFWISQKRHPKIIFIVYDTWDRSNIGKKRCAAVHTHCCLQAYTAGSYCPYQLIVEYLIIAISFSHLFCIKQVAIHSK